MKTNFLAVFKYLALFSIVLKAEVTFPQITTKEGLSYSNAVIRSADAEKIKICYENGSYFLYYKDISTNDLLKIKSEVDRLKSTSQSDLQKSIEANIYNSSVLGKTEQECRSIYGDSTVQSNAYFPTREYIKNEVSISITFLNGRAERVEYTKTYRTSQPSDIVAQKVSETIESFKQLLKSKILPNHTWKEKTLRDGTEYETNDNNFWASITIVEYQLIDVKLVAGTKAYIEANMARQNESQKTVTDKLKTQINGL